MLIMCDKDCKEGLPIPFIGYVCLGVSELCSSIGVISEAIEIAPGCNDRLNSAESERAKSGCGNCCCEGCSK